ncbi:protocadherin-10-like [Narcine bancroftii]|uniref:protocadherin-10-like n=1 Tax=Narcine bancroftii TaxID=1343680 RepID=UPI003831D95C
MRDNIHWLLKYQLFGCLFGHWNLISGQVRYSVPEELQPGAFVGDIAFDLGLDLKQLSARSLRVAPSPRKQYVDINLENGNLFVNENIDREQLCGTRNDCILSLNVVLENPPTLHQVEVEILDVNDNAPSFPKSQVRLEISEIMAPGARFPLEVARDPDIGTNSLQTYQLLPSEYFILDVQTRSGKRKLPVLVLQRPLDRETLPRHDLTLLAEDGGVPVRSGKLRVTIEVQDANDNIPVFSQSVYLVSLLESTPTGTLIIKLNATDLDEGTNGEITYMISSHSSENVPEFFHVNSKTGEVRLKKRLDYEQCKFFEINVQAVDNGPNAMPQQCDVLVNVTDVNDNVPDMTLTSSSSIVSENASVGTVVALLHVEDKDAEQNGQVQCHISGNLPFKLDSTSENFSRLIIQRTLDRETISRYDITITCTDAGNPALTAKETLRVIVSDVNDNAPMFTQPVYTVNIVENNVIGASISSLTALDPDVGQNARLNFSMLPSNVYNTSIASYISVNPKSGVILAQRSFDYEQLKEFKIYVQVHDSGLPPLSSNALVHIIIVDQNDNAPVIVNPLPKYGSTAIETISRFAEPGYLVVKVSAIDADVGQNARLSYHISEATHRNLFTISADTGEIWTIRGVGSRDSSKQRLVIFVKDHGIPPLSASITIVLYVNGGENFSSATSLSEDLYFSPGLNFYLVIALGTTSIVFLLILIILTVKVYKHPNNDGHTYCSQNHCCCFETRNSLNGIQKASRSLQIPPNYVEVFGGDPLSQSFRYESCSTLHSNKRDFTTPQTYSMSTAVQYTQKNPDGNLNARVAEPEESNETVKFKQYPAQLYMLPALRNEQNPYWSNSNEFFYQSGTEM